MSDINTQIHDFYRQFNARNIDAVVDELHEDVDWPNAWEGGDIHGRDAVRAYWLRQWDAIEPIVTPKSIEVEDDGRVTVHVDQKVSQKDGTLISHTNVLHVYTFDNNLVTLMEVNEIGSADS